MDAQEGGASRRSAPDDRPAAAHCGGPAAAACCACRDSFLRGVLYQQKGLLFRGRAPASSRFAQGDWLNVERAEVPRGDCPGVPKNFAVCPANQQVTSRGDFKNPFVDADHGGSRPRGGIVPSGPGATRMQCDFCAAAARCARANKGSWCNCAQGPKALACYDHHHRWALATSPGRLRSPSRGHQNLHFHFAGEKGAGHHISFFFAGHPPMQKRPTFIRKNIARKRGSYSSHSPGFFQFEL